MSASNAAMTIASWDSSKHPRAKAGASGGGQFAPLSYDSSKKTGAGYGSKAGDQRVHDAQEALRKAGLTDADGVPLKLDGKLGPRTTESIKAYQRAHGIKPADGKITPKLLGALKKAPAKGATHKKTALAKKPTLPRRATS